jgi:ATP-binding cassette subfamily B protein RaxB
MAPSGKIIYQAESNECGLACLSMVLHRHGHHVSLDDLRSFAGPFPQGMTVADISDVAERKGLVCRPLRVEIDELNQLMLPAILHWDMDHFVVLERVRRKGATLLDPARGRIEVRRHELSKHFTGVAIELLKGPNLQRQAERKPLKITSLIGPVFGLRRALINLGLLSLGLEVIALASPQAFQVIIDRVLADGDKGLLPVVIIALTMLAALQIFFTWIRSWSIVWMSSQINIGWSSGLFSRLLRLPSGYFQTRTLGDINSRFGSLYSIQQSISTQLVAGVLDGMMSVATGIMLFIYSPLLAAFTLCAALAYIAIRLAYVKRLRLSTVSSLIEDARRQSLLLESIRGAQTLKLFGKTAWQASRYANRAAAAAGASAMVQRTTLTYNALGGVALSAARVGSLAFGATLVLSGKFTAGMLVAYASYAEQFVGRLTSLVEYATQLSLLRSQAERVADIALASPEKEPAVPRAAPEGPLEIELRDVSFRYAENQPWVLNRANLVVPSGKMTAITGPSGCGKSTIAKLMMGLLEPINGDILFNGVSIRDIGPTKVRRVFGCVMQDDILFQGTLRDNITLFEEKDGQDRVHEVARLACIQDDIIRMPMGYRTMVGDMGSSLSGGQRQRMMLARALYRLPSAVILDEAGSHLDSETENRINMGLKSLGLTIVQIAHRRETVDSADHVLALKRDGTIEAMRRC